MCIRKITSFDTWIDYKIALAWLMYKCYGMEHMKLGSLIPGLIISRYPDARMVEPEVREMSYRIKEVYFTATKRGEAAAAAAAH